MNWFNSASQCHRSETVTHRRNTGNIAINWPVIVATDLGSCADGSAANYITCTTTDGSTWNFVPTTGTKSMNRIRARKQLASPHAKFIGTTLTMNNQNSADLSIKSGTINVASNFLTINQFTTPAAPRAARAVTIRTSPR